jgi:hypothetical protein
VSGNGPFAFASLVHDHASYNVTVRTYPTGQTCSVAAGSGSVAGVDVTNVGVTCSSNAAPTSASDNFARTNSGSLGPNWTDMADGGMAISAQAAIGGAGVAGDMWTEASFTSDQFAQITLTSAQLTGNQWIGAAVRAQHGGQDAYVALYTLQGGPQIMLFLRQGGGTWNALGSYNCGLLPAGTRIGMTAVGNTVTVTENGVQRIGVGDSTLTGGAPGIIANGAAQAATWSGGNAGFQVSYRDTSSGIKNYDIVSKNDGYGPQTLRVLQPTAPASGVAHNFMIVLPVEPGLGTTYGDGLATVQALDAQDQYNLTVVEPTFTYDPWDADNATDPNMRYETFLTQELVPWLKSSKLATTGNEQVWLLGFSKSGYGAQDLILKNPGVFTLAASWDFPADMAAYDWSTSSQIAYGTDANFQDNYRLTPSFVQGHAASFQDSNRIWIGGYMLYQNDMSDYDALLSDAGIEHTTETPTLAPAHRWDAGWMPQAIAGLYDDSVNLPPG